MMSEGYEHDREHLDGLVLYVLHALPASEFAVVENRVSRCVECQREIETLRPIVRAFVAWPIDVLRPAESLWGRLSERIAREDGTRPFVPAPERPFKPEWEEAAPGVNVKILARDDNDTVSMLVRLAPGASYPGHTHAAVEELHLLYGELKVDDRTLRPGDFIHAEPGSVDQRVWSETGCTCVLVTSSKDTLF